MTQENKPQPMGIGLLGNRNITFSSKIRYILEAQHLPKDFVRYKSIDCKNRIFSFAYCDAREGQDEQETYHALRWVQAMEQKSYPDECITLNVYNGFGYELYAFTFYDLTLLEHSRLDCAISDAHWHSIKVKFENYFLLNSQFKELRIHPSASVQCKKILAE